MNVFMLKKPEDQEHYPINKDNIVEVLEYNKSLGLKIDSIKKTDNYICYRQLINGKWENVRWGFAFNWLDHIELDLGVGVLLTKKWLSPTELLIIFLLMLMRIANYTVLY